MAAAVAVLAALGCDDPSAPVDPDGKSPRDLRREAELVAERLTEVRLGPVIAAAAGVREGDAPAVLEAWLARAPMGRVLTLRWPRTASGALDLDRAPLTAREVRATLVRASPERCAEVRVLFTGLGPPALRLHVPLPATTRACRAAGSGGGLVGPSAFDALNEAIAADVIATPELLLP